jgi:hypothetical protein
VDELLGKYEADKQLDANKNATALAIASLNNDSRERVEELKLGVQASQQQAELEHAREMLGTEASITAQQAIQNHGLDVAKARIDSEAQLTQQALQQAQLPQNNTIAPEGSGFPLPVAPPMKEGGLADQAINQELSDGQLSKAQVVAKLMNERKQNGSKE